jgi:iron uptake system component EfeO
MRPRYMPAALLAVAGVALVSCSSAGGAGTPGPGSRSGTGGPGSGSAAHSAHVTITAAHGCVADHDHLAAGGVTVTVANKDATAVSEVELLDGERILGEKENIPPGFGGQFAVTLAAGTYTLYCPGASPEKTTVTVTGAAARGANDAVAALLKQAVIGYASYVDAQVGELLRATRHFDATLHGRSLAAAQTAYMRARPYYEKIEPVAESFVIGKNSLDTDIDARANDVPASQWRGFHRIEKSLFADHTLRGTAHYGDLLVADVAKLRRLTAGLQYQPTELANGAQELLDEVAASKITGEEERYSHIDLLDIAANDEGAEQAFAQLQPALERIDAGLAGQVSRAFDQLDDLVNSYRTGSNPSGFRLYTSLTDSDKRSLAAAVKAVAEPLSQVASKVAGR